MMTETEKLDLILKDLTQIKSDVSDLKSDVCDLKSDMNTVKTKIIKMDMIIDNELRVNIQRVAEGHLDLSGNLHEAMKPSSELELLSIKVRRLESDVLDLKQKIS